MTDRLSVSSPESGPCGRNESLSAGQPREVRARGARIAPVPAAYAILCAVVALIGAGLLVYSQTWAFANDEGFHLLAAQLIGRGQRPYLDFFFPQAPLNAYWNALWMGLFGESWRVAHAVAALAVAAAVFLVTDHVYRRFPDAAWRLPAALTAAFCFGLNELVVTFGTVQAYGLCLLLGVGAFRCAVEAARKGPAWAAAAGVCATGAAMASLLAVPVAPVLLAWLAWRSRRRGGVLLAFCIAGVVPLLPLAWLFVQGPRQVLFALIEYHGLYRQVGWPGASAHNFEVYVAWINSGPALVLGGLATAALVLAVRAARFREWRAELVLAGALAAAQIAFLCTLVPTHQRYFLLAVPFLAALAPAGVHALAAGLRPRAAVAVIGAFLALATAKALFDGRDDYLWSDAEQIAAEIERVTPPGAPILAEERIHFLTRRPPVPGLEHLDALKLSLPADMNRMLRLASREDAARAIGEGRFATVEVCSSDEVKETAEAEGLFAEVAGKAFAEASEFGDCTVYWRPARPVQ